MSVEVSQLTKTTTNVFQLQEITRSLRRTKRVDRDPRQEIYLADFALLEYIGLKRLPSDREIRIGLTPFGDPNEISQERFNIIPGRSYQICGTDVFFSATIRRMSRIHAPNISFFIEAPEAIDIVILKGKSTTRSLL